MNALLVADEIRARIMREAIGLSEDEATPTDEWMWKPLAYPTTAVSSKGGGRGGVEVGRAG